MRSVAADVEWTLVPSEERAGGRAWALDRLTSFEQASAELYGALKGRGDPKLRDDLSPMFGVIWGSTRVLVDRLLRAGDALRDRDVLEIGCGLGWPSMVAASLGARAVATDQHPDAGPLLAHNAARNQVEVRYAPLDLRAPAGLPEGGFQFVLAADVLFAREMPELVAAGFARYLAPGGVGWLADPGRPWVTELTAAARRRGRAVDVDAERGGAGEAVIVTLRRC